MRKQVRNLRYIFHPKSIAVIGASVNSSKVGHVVVKNLVESKFNGKVYPINPKYTEVLGLRCYPSVLKVSGSIDCAVIAIPSHIVPSVLEECGKKGIKAVIVLSGGFGEVGNKDLEERVKDISDKYNIALLGPNCLGILNPYERIDSIFLPMYKLKRPRPGGISFITQSGAVGTCVVDLAAHYGVGIAKFISYGNATVIDESDLLEFLEHDDKTEIILVYIEGVRDGRRLLRVMSRINRKKPIVVLKAGRGKSASMAAASHTGNLAGSYLAYKSAFKQAKVVIANSLDELFEFVRIFNQPLPKGDRVAVITNGGGLGVLTADRIENVGLRLASFSGKIRSKLRKILPAYANIGNPLDIIADATPDLYNNVLNVMMDCKDVDSIIVIVLFQAPAIDERLLTYLIKASDLRKKPITVIAVGGEYTDGHRKILDSYGVPTYSSPSDAVKALKKLTYYSMYKDKWVKE